MDTVHMYRSQTTSGHMPIHCFYSVSHVCLQGPEQEGLTHVLNRPMDKAQEWQEPEHALFVFYPVYNQFYASGIHSSFTNSLCVLHAVCQLPSLQDLKKQLAEIERVWAPKRP